MKEHKEFYKSNGKLRYHCYLDKHGKRHGESIEYYTTGAIKFRQISRHGYTKGNAMGMMERSKELVELAEHLGVPLLPNDPNDREESLLISLKHGIQML